LTILDNNLHFLVGEAELPSSADLINRLRSMIVNIEAKAEQAQVQTEQAQAQAEQAQAQGAASALLTVLRARGIAVTDALRERILAEKDVKRIERWLEKAIVAASLDEVLDEPG